MSEIDKSQAQNLLDLKNQLLRRVIKEEMERVNETVRP